jgi:uncharacterized protein YyaL (SSP411 family)
MSTHTHTNRLAQETSPYLLQHAHNPVDWYPWGEEAFAAARSQNKPIFLSVGYSTCYWCHVMERQSFENEAIAQVMNEKFINIKVDREERPDVDQLYMTAVQILTRHGGWPMSVFLLPDLRPFYGGTYFPPEDAHGRPGFPTLLRAIEDAFRNRRGEVEQSATQLANILQQIAQPAAPSSPISIDDRFIEALVERSMSDYEPMYGGFGSAPKFPRETLLEMLLVHQQTQPNERRMQKIRHALDAMAAGGIRDHLGGGFHRYSTDAKWLVPHFEIMLYDNALLGWCYAEAFRQTNEKRYARTARGIFDFILREMTSPEGAFYTALDAEVDSQEGLNYLWTAEQVRRTLTDEPGKGMGAPFSDADAKLFLTTYGLDLGPNFADPHHGSGRPDKNILYLPGGVGSDEDSRLEPMRKWLLEERSKRKQPLLDTKVITSWNALMIRALAFGGKVLAEQRYTTAAQKAAEYLLKRHRTSDGGVFRASRDGKAKYNGFIDDYAFLAQSLLALHDATDDAKWRERATEIMTETRKRFGDPKRGAFYFSEENARDLIVRQKVATDSPLPSGNAIAAMALLELGDVDAARRTIAVFAEQIESNGEGMSSMVEAAMLYLRRAGAFKVSSAEQQQQADRPLSPQEIAAGVVAAHGEWLDARQLRLRLQILAGFHINAHETMKDLIATAVMVDPASTVDGIDYPPGEMQSFAFADQPIRVYSGDVTILIRFKSLQREAPRVAIQYQACDESACFAPVRKPVEVIAPG